MKIVKYFLAFLERAALFIIGLIIITKAFPEINGHSATIIVVCGFVFVWSGSLQMLVHEENKCQDVK